MKPQVDYHQQIREEFNRLLEEKPTWGKKEVSGLLDKAEINVARKLLTEGSK